MLTKLIFGWLALSLVIFCAGTSPVCYAAESITLEIPAVKAAFDPAAATPLDILHAGNAIRHPEQYGMDFVKANLSTMLSRLTEIVNVVRCQPMPDQRHFLQMLALSQVPPTHLDLNPLKDVFELRKESQFKPIYQKAAIEFANLMREFQIPSDGLTIPMIPGKPGIIVAAPLAPAQLRTLPPIWVEIEKPAPDSIDSVEWLKGHANRHEQRRQHTNLWHRHLVEDLVLEMWHRHPQDTRFAIVIKQAGRNPKPAQSKIGVIDLSRARIATEAKRLEYIGRGLAGFTDHVAPVQYPEGMAWNDFRELIAQHGVIVKRIPN